jgi:hypothetical protein
VGCAFKVLADDAAAASFGRAGLARLLVPEASAVTCFSRDGDGFPGFVSSDQVQEDGLTDSTIEFDHAALDFAPITLPFELFLGVLDQILTRL